MLFKKEEKKKGKKKQCKKRAFTSQMAGFQEKKKKKENSKKGKLGRRFARLPADKATHWPAACSCSASGSFALALAAVPWNPARLCAAVPGGLRPQEGAGGGALHATAPAREPPAKQRPEPQVPPQHQLAQPRRLCFCRFDEDKQFQSPKL